MKLHVLTLGLLVSFAVRAEPDVAKFYEVSTDGTSKAVKAGEAGKVVIAINAKDGAHVSDEAPLRIELSSAQATLSKQKLTLADSITKKAPGVQYPNPRFEVTFTPAKAGQATVEAKMVFFICTEKLCSRQTKNLTLVADVR